MTAGRGVSHAEERTVLPRNDPTSGPPRLWARLEFGQHRRHDRHPPGRRQRHRQLRRQQLPGRAIMARASIDVTIVGGSVQLAEDGKVIRVPSIHHDRTKELGAFATPKGRPRKDKTA